MTWCYQNISQLNSEKQSIKMENVLNKTKRHKNWELTTDHQNEEELKQQERNKFSVNSFINRNTVESNHIIWIVELIDGRNYFLYHLS